MKSKWFELKDKAIALRLKGGSLRKINKQLRIPKSTLSGWFKTTTLSKKYQLILESNRLKALIKARKLAVLWHNTQKNLRLKEAENQALISLRKIDCQDKAVLELALAMLYLGEGLKVGATAMGNSNPLILKFFIASLIKIYNFDISKIKCELHLRADQNPFEIRKYWSEELNIPLTNFSSISIDKRTQGSPTYSTYKGVCILQCGNIALQRRLVYLGQRFCENIANLRAVSSAGRASA